MSKMLMFITKHVDLCGHRGLWCLVYAKMITIEKIWLGRGRIYKRCTLAAKPYVHLTETSLQLLVTLIRSSTFFFSLTKLQSESRLSPVNYKPLTIRCRQVYLSRVFIISLQNNLLVLRHCVDFINCFLIHLHNNGPP